MSNLNLLKFRSPAFELPKPLVVNTQNSLLNLQGLSTSVNMSPPPCTDPSSLQQSLEKIEKIPLIFDIGTQFDEVPPQPDRRTSETTTEMKFLEVSDIVENKGCPQVNLEYGALIIPAPTQTFIDVYDIPEKKGEALIDEYAERDRIEGAALLQEEEQRLLRLKQDPQHDYKQSKEYKLKLLNDQLKKIENSALTIEKDLKKHTNTIEEVNTTYKGEVESAKKKAALEILNNMEARLELVPQHEEAPDEVSALLKSNSNLYEDIEKSFAKPPKKFYQKPLIPNVLPQARVKKNLPAARTRRISQAMKLAEEAIKLSTLNDF